MVGELDDRKLPQLIELKYHAVNYAVVELGGPGEIRESFTGFQRHLYEPEVAAGPFLPNHSGLFAILP